MRIYVPSYTTSAGISLAIILSKMVGAPLSASAAASCALDCSSDIARTEPLKLKEDALGGGEVFQEGKEGSPKGFFS